MREVLDRDAVAPKLNSRSPFARHRKSAVANQPFAVLVPGMQNPDPHIAILDDLPLSLVPEELREFLRGRAKGDREFSFGATALRFRGFRGAGAFP